jgi:hypothetical protein
MKKPIIPIIRGLLFAALLIMGLSGCIKRPVTPYLPVPQDLMDILVFHPGSYWIYNYMNIGDDPDSTYVTSDPTDKTVEEGYPGYRLDMESYKITYNSAFLDSVIILHDTYILYFQGQMFAGSEAATFQPGYYSVTGTRDTLRCVALLPSLALNGNTFNNVYVTQYSTFTIQNLPDIYTLYFVKNTGLVQLEHTVNGKGYLWNLIRYHAVQ